MARPCKLTPQLQAVIVAYIRMGNWPEIAAAAAGICKKTFYNWMRRGRSAKSGRYADFVAAIDEAMALFEANAVTRLGSSPDWRATKYRLERRVPERWGPNAGGDNPERARSAILALMDTLRRGGADEDPDDSPDANGEGGAVDS